MADSTIKVLTEQTTALVTDLLYLVDPTEGVPDDENKYITLSNLGVLINSIRATVTNSDSNVYVQWESGSVWTITRIVDGFWATIANNPTMTTAALAWTNRATLTYTVDGT